MFHFMSSMKERSCFNFLSKLMVACLVYSLAFGQCSLSYAQVNLNLPVPGAMVNASSAYVPVLLKGMTVHPDDPFRFDFIVDNGNSKLAGQELQKESKKLVNYFLTAMTVPGNDLWVNLSPVEKDRIIPDALNTTELGYGLLAQDYILKQLTASLIYPESDLGKKFWERVYQKTQEKFGTADIPTDTFNKVWIMPEAATVYERGTSVYIVDAKLKVMLDTDREASLGNGSLPLVGEVLAREERDQGRGEEELAKAILREIILPEIEKEVNSGENFAPLRQIYYALIFAKWYKEKVRNSILSKVYIDQNKVKGVDVNDPARKEQVYTRYMEAYKKGVYNYVKEEVDALTQEVTPRKYFSGGFQDAAVTFNHTDKAQDVKGALVGDNFKLNVKIDAQQDNAEFSKDKKDLTAGYSRDFAQRSRSLWRAGKRALSLLLIVAVLGMVPVGCTKPTKPDTEIPHPPGDIEHQVTDDLRALIMADSALAVASPAYQDIVQIGNVATAVLIQFAQNVNENINARRWAIKLLGAVSQADGAFDFLITVLGETTTLYSTIHKMEASGALQAFLLRNAGRYTLYANTLMATSNTEVVNVVLSAVYEVGKTQPMVVRGLTLASEGTTGTVKQSIDAMIARIITEALSGQYATSVNGINQALVGLAGSEDGVFGILATVIDTPESVYPQAIKMAALAAMRGFLVLFYENRYMACVDVLINNPSEAVVTGVLSVLYDVGKINWSVLRALPLASAGTTGMIKQSIDAMIKRIIRESLSEQYAESWANHQILVLLGNNDLWFAFIKDVKEKLSNRIRAIDYLDLNANNVFNFLVTILDGPGNVYPDAIKTAAAGAMKNYLIAHPDQYMLCVNVLKNNPGMALMNGVLSAVYDAGRENSSVLRALTVASAGTAGNVKKNVDAMIARIVDEILDLEYPTHDQVLGETLVILGGEALTDQIIAFCQDPQNNTDDRKYAMIKLGYVGEYNRSYNYLKSVIEGASGYAWWHEVEAERGLIGLIRRQSDPSTIANNLINTAGTSVRMIAAAYHVLLCMNTAQSIQQVVDGLTNYPDPLVRIRIIWGLHYFDQVGFSFSHQDLLFDRLEQDPDVSVQVEIVPELFDCIWDIAWNGGGNSEIFQRLLHPLRYHSEAAVRATIAQRFGLMGSNGSGALPTLYYLRDYDPDQGVRERADEAIHNITGGGKGLKSPARHKTNIDHAQGQDLTAGYSRDFAQASKSLWRTGKDVLMALIVIAFVGMVPVACTKSPTKPNVEIPQEDIKKFVTDNLRSLTMTDPNVADTTKAYQDILVRGNSAAVPLMEFIQNANEQTNPRRWAIRLLGMVGSETSAFDLLIAILNDTGDLYGEIHKTEAMGAMRNFLMRNTDQYAVSVQALTDDPTPVVVQEVLSALYDVGNWYPSVLQALPAASAGTTGTVKQGIDAMITRIVNESLNYQYAYAENGQNQALVSLGEAATQPIIAYCSNEQNDTDNRKMGMVQLGYVGEYSSSYNYLKTVVESSDGLYQWWHRVEAENGLAVLIKRQPNANGIVNGLLNMSGISAQMLGVAYHVLFDMNTAASITQFLDGLRDHPNFVVRAHIVWVFSYYQNTAFILSHKDFLLERLQQDPNDEVKMPLAQALFQVAGTDVVVFNGLAQQVRYDQSSQSAATRAMIAQNFGNMGSAAVGAISALEYARDHDPDANVQAWAFWAINQINGGGKMAPSRGKIPAKYQGNVDKAQGLEKVDVAVGYSKDFAQRSGSLWRAGVNALWMMVIIGFIGMVPVACTKSPTKPDIEIPTDPQEINRVVVENLRQLTTSQPSIAMASPAYHMILRIGAPATDALIAFAQNTNELVDPRKWANRLIGEVGVDDRALNFFIGAFNGEFPVFDLEVDNGFALFIGRINKYAFCLSFLQSSYSDHVKGRVMMSLCINARTDQRGTQALVSALNIATGEALWTVVWYMPRVPQGVTPVLAIFNNIEQDPATRIGAAQFLGQVEDPGTVDVRRNALSSQMLDREHNQSAVRQFSASGLGDLGDARAIPALEDARDNDPDESVRLAAQAAIDQINGGWKMAPSGGNSPAKYQGKIVQKQVNIDKAQAKDLGGIDMNDIQIKGKGNGPGIEFDPRVLETIANMKVDGFAPVIIELTPVKDVLPLLI